MAASLQTRVLYGLKTDIIGNAHYITDAEILYPVGNVLAIHNVLQYQQKLIRLSDKNINVICVSANKKYVAVSEVGDKPTISVYDLQSLKRRKLLGIPFDTPGVTRFTSIGFTFDSKNLVAITGEPDLTLLFYNWEKGKVESMSKLANPQNPLAIPEILACNPTDSSVVAVGGPYNFKFLIVSETIWRAYGFTKGDSLLVSSMTWLDSDRMLVGTEEGRVLYMENGDLKNIYWISDTMSMNLKIREEYVMPVVASLPVTLDNDQEELVTWEQNVRCLIGFPRGFAYAHGPGTIILFEKEGKHKYTKRNIYVLPKQVLKDEDPNLYKINMIDVNPGLDQLIITAGWSQLYYAALWGLDLQKDPKPQLLRIMGQPLHHGPISGLATCAWKPVFMTCGELDRSVRLWNFETESMIMLKQYTEDIYGIALHPMGLFCLIGFTDKLRFMSILIDDLLPMQEIAIRSCTTIRFSYGGHLFAAVSGNVVQVYTTIGFYNPFILKGHTGRVKALLWSQTDLKMLSMGTEGAIYEWDMTTGMRSGEIILKGIILHDIALSSDTSFFYCIANDDYIREIKKNEVIREFFLPGREMHQMLMGKDDITLFITSGGIIISLKCPLQTPIESLDFHIHSVDITQIALPYNENCLISVAKDGSLCIWKLFYPEGKAKISRDLPYTHEVLIGTGDLEEKMHTIKSLTVRMREMETEHAYKLRQIDVQHNDTLRAVHQGYCEAIEELRDKIEKLEEDHINEINNINVEIMKMKKAHEEAMRQMESNYEIKLITEYDKYQAFEERTTIMRENYEKQLKDLEKRDAEELQRTVTKYEALLHEKKVELEESSDEMAHKERVHEHLMAQIEDDADREILEIRTKYENLLYEERQANLKLKGEAGLMRNKFIASQRDVDDLKRQVHRVQSEFEQFHKNIQELEKQIAELKKEISERNAIIQDKEQQIYDMKQTNQELEKFKFVLNYKIEELKNQIEPRDREIQELKENIRDMEAELISLQKTKVNLELQLHEAREKLRAARQELDREMHKNKRCEQLVRKIRVDILNAAGLIQEPNALKTAVRDLYHKYSADDEFLRSRKADVDAQCEFIKQRDYLERTVASLRKQVFQDTATGDKGLEKMIEENSMLIVELNALRQELKETRQHIFHIESLLGLTRKVQPLEARKKLDKVYRGYEELQEKYTTQMQEYQQVILALKEDIKRLLSKVPCEEMETEKKES
ncbi:cilia- and flagella-associated protein 57 [Cataglyphis hispanica]|uniref:cilia- and flagella-associated protein 57 n=1 Tax=Cataglyphis hispanica TaxID=1086592 RepID=UPI00217F65DC|nr:cilia- and flagella-associated protein 57 [Cataglyphis hispanica]